MTNNNEHPPIQPRGFLDIFFDRSIAWLFGYPPERCGCTAQTVKIPISDNLSRIELVATLYQPDLPVLEKPRGTILIRCPYGRSFPISSQARTFAARGYQVLLVSCRGTFGSGGEFDAFSTEVQDGKDVVEWMRKQEWYTGTFATVGGSYLGFVQWALLYDPPEDMVAAVVTVSPHDFSRAIRGTGALELDIVGWADNIAHQEEPNFLWRNLTSRWSSKNIGSVLKTVPLAQNAEAYIGKGYPWLHKILTTSEISDAYYTPMRLGRALERANIPVLIGTGWKDCFIEQSIEQYLKLKERGCNVGLTVGPWTHITSGVSAKLNKQGFDWIEEHVSGSDEARRAHAVEYFVTGSQEWKSVSEYPPVTEAWALYLSPSGKLAKQLTSSDQGQSSFTFDPQQPTPTMGGNGLLSGGVVDDSALVERDDVCVFDTAPLEEDVEICGKPFVELWHSTSSPYADVFVRISEVDGKGRSRNVTDGFQRLDPKRDAAVNTMLSLNPCAHRFGRGKKIRLMVAGGNFPKYARNHGVANDDNNGVDMCAVNHVISHDEARPSRVVLPVV